VVSENIINAINNYTTNGQLIKACHQLGYINSPVLDCTYGYGKFWTEHTPQTLIGTDLNPDKALDGKSTDFTNLPYPDNYFATVIFDPPYKLNGTPSHQSDERYGVNTTVRWQDRHELINKGIEECARVLQPRGHLLIKCQDQVVSGRIRWQTHIFTQTAEQHRCHLEDKLHLTGSRPQPTGTTQKHARRNYSTLLITKKV